MLIITLIINQVIYLIQIAWIKYNTIAWQH